MRYTAHGVEGEEGASYVLDEDEAEVVSDWIGKTSGEVTIVVEHGAISFSSQSFTLKVTADDA